MSSGEAGEEEGFQKEGGGVDSLEEEDEEEALGAIGAMMKSPSVTPSPLGGDDRTRG